MECWAWAWAQLRYHHHHHRSSRLRGLRYSIGIQIVCGFCAKVTWLTSRCSPLPVPHSLLFSFLIMPVQKSDLVSVWFLHLYFLLWRFRIPRESRHLKSLDSSARKFFFCFFLEYFSFMWTTFCIFSVFFFFFGCDSVTDPVGLLGYDTKHICPHDNAPESQPIYDLFFFRWTR